MSDDVTDLPVRHRREDEGKLFLVPPPASKCQHYIGPFEVDPDAGGCRCRQCGEDVSPMFVLERMLRKESQWLRAHDRYNDEMKRLAERSKTKCRHCKKMTPISRT